jgi:hypothetical protein
MAGQRFTNANRGRTRVPGIAATNPFDRRTGGLASATRDLTGDGVVVANAREHFSEASISVGTLAA